MYKNIKYRKFAPIYLQMFYGNTKTVYIFFKNLRGSSY